MKKMITALCLLFSLNALSQTTYFVNDNASGVNNGSSWTDAFTKLQDALTAAVSGDQIWVAAGIYYPDEGVGLTNNNRSHSFHLKDGVAIYGGFAGTETLLNERNVTTNVSTLSGDIDQNDLAPGGGNNNNALNVVQSSSVGNSALLDGFTITGGNANSFPDNFGGGMSNSSSSPSLVNCSFSGNLAGLSGGGIYNTSSSPILTNCSFSGNIAFINGGGIFNNANSSPVLTNCSFSENGADVGGAIRNDNSSAPSLTNCSFSGNTAGSSGGGIANSFSAPSLTNCSFSGNTAGPSGGGGIYNFFSSPILPIAAFQEIWLLVLVLAVEESLMTILLLHSSIASFGATQLIRFLTPAAALWLPIPSCRVAFPARAIWIRTHCLWMQQTGICTCRRAPLPLMQV